MSHYSFKKKLPFLIPVIMGALLFAGSSCKKNTVAPTKYIHIHDTVHIKPKPIVHFLGDLTGSTEVPSVNTAAEGSVTAIYDPETKLLSYYITWTQLSSKPTAINFYAGAPGKNGPVVITISSFSKEISGSLTGKNTNKLTKSQESDLMAGHFYANILTGKHPKGEMRAQIVEIKYP